ncbi:MAG: hypothetical protein J6S85_10480 [Methanobrevibacter sp.]|nr:hypothetical protein [Methanobrevibacter sp.]
MGRYYSGDIEGKFWFGVQSSTAADRFGVESSEPGYVTYYFDSDNLQDIKDELERIKKNLGKYKELLDKFFEGKGGYTFEELQEYLGVDEDKRNYLLSEYADLGLGEKILKCVEENGDCTFDAEL